MTAYILYFCAYVYHLFVPGYLVAELLGLRRGRFLLALAISYALLVLNLIPMERARAPLWVFFLLFNLQVLILLAANMIAWRRRHARLAESGPKTCRPSTSRSCLRRLLVYGWAPLAIVAGVLAYLGWAGPYTELPADPWQHIVRFTYAWNTSISPGHLEPIWRWGGSWTLPGCLTSQGGFHWYILHGLLCKAGGISILDSWLPLTIANTCVFLLAVYWFAMFLWSHLRLSRARKIQASLLAVCFTGLWLGINIFAYIRYYALAPAILNYAMYLAVVVLVLDYFRSRSWRGHAVWLAPLIVMTMNVIHTQEAAFVFFMGLGILLVIEGRWAWARSRGPEVRGQRSEVGNLPAKHANGRENIAGAQINMRKIHVLFFAGLIFIGLLWYYSLHRPMGAYSGFVFKPLFHGEWLGQQWFIQPPAGQFFQVVTWWGLFVYALFLLYAGSFKRQPFILAGMLMPCLVAFNPVSLAILSRWMPDLNAIYRFNYTIPLPLVAGFLAMNFANELKAWWRTLWGGARDRSGEVAASSRSAAVDKDAAGKPAAALSKMRQLFFIPLWAGGCLVALLVLLTPWEPLLGMRTNSRFYTLKPVAEGNDQRRWGDLIALVRQQPHAQVLTDPYTFILLRWLGVSVIDGDWWNRMVAPDADRMALLRNLDRKYDWWLVVNRRDGDFSPNGARSGHWFGDALMHCSTAYPDDMLLFVREHPELFREIWSKDRIQVYAVDASRLRE